MRVSLALGLCLAGVSSVLRMNVVEVWCFFTRCGDRYGWRCGVLCGVLKKVGYLFGSGKCVREIDFLAFE